MLLNLFKYFRKAEYETVQMSLSLTLSFVSGKIIKKKSFVVKNFFFLWFLKPLIRRAHYLKVRPNVFYGWWSAAIRAQIVTNHRMWILENLLHSTKRIVTIGPPL